MNNNKQIQANIQTKMNKNNKQIQTNMQTKINI